MACRKVPKAMLGRHTTRNLILSRRFSTDSRGQPEQRPEQ